MKKSAIYSVALLFFLMLILGQMAASAATFVRMADSQLADQASIIAEVRVLAVEVVGAQQTTTEVSVEIVDLIDGYVPGGSIVVRIPGGPGLIIPGAPHFTVGESALLFLATRDDGTFGILHLMLGAFQIVDVGGQRLVFRDLSEATEVVWPGQESAAPEQPRDLERFRSWLRDHVRGAVRSADYWTQAPASFVPDVHEKFTLLGPGRWTQFDSGGSVEFRAHSSGQSGQPGGGFSEFQTAMAAWNNHATTPIRYTYGGTTSASGGLTNRDGTNAILFGDPNDRIDGAYDCESRTGTLAIGGFYPSTQEVVHNGQTFEVALEGDIVTNDNIECELPGRRLLEEVMAHELGHTLGLGHSSSSSALMFRFAHGDGRGARLSSDDRNGITFIYGDPPTAPSDLAAESRDDGIRLTWRDNSNDETKFEIMRSAGGSFARLSLPNANTTAFLDTSATGGRTFTYRVRALNVAGESDFSNDASATAPGFAPPANLAAAARSDSTIELTWLDETEDETEFRIEAKTGAEPFALVATVPAETELAVIDSLLPETTYTFRARAFGPQGFSDYSNEASATTFGATCECVEGPTTMCLEGGRFRVEANWRDFDDGLGDGQVVDFGSNNSGLFWFFSRDNWEMLIKVLDGCGFNDRYWVFAAATTDVEYNLEVTDCWTGGTARYTNELGNASAAITDSGAFATCSALPPEGFVAREPIEVPRFESSEFPAIDGEPALPEKMGDCVPSETELCLNEGRFKVEIEWRDFEGEVGTGHVVPTDSDDSGLLWFFSAPNWEMLIKVLNGCAINDHYWVFAAATTDVEYTLRVTDTQTGEISVYQNAIGNAADAITDTAAFEACP